MDNLKLQEAVDIFKELGWEEVTPENVLQLSLGSPEQKRKALAGLKSGKWGEFAKLDENTYGWRSFVGVDEGKLALFAVRVGVDAQRAVSVLRRENNELFVRIIAERGEKFASDFIRYACVSGLRSWEHSASVFGSTAVLLVDKMSLEIPQTIGYMKDWSVYAAAAMGLKAETFHKETDLPGLELIEKRFIEHIQTGVAVGAAATGPFGAVFPEGVKRGFIDREEAVDLAFFALDAAVRPGDRKVWLRILDELGVTDAEFCARVQSLIPLLATGDTAVVTRLAPVLIANTEEELLTEVITAAFSTGVNKARQLVLKAALERSCPKNAEALSVWLAMLSNDKDKKLSQLAGRLMEQWNIHMDLPEEMAEIQGLWRHTPEVWHMPPFETGEASPEALTALTAQLVGQAAVVHDVTAEQFLAVANAVARQNPEAARMSLRGLRHEDPLLYFVGCWAKGEEPRYGFDKDGENNDMQTFIQHPLTARDYVVALNLGQMPCLLSTPVSVDLSVSVPELSSRLALYHGAKADVLEADLFLALTRLDLTTATEEARLELERLDVPILLQSGEKMPVSAGEAVLTYLNDPIKEPPLDLSDNGYWGSVMRIPTPESLCDFPSRLSAYPSERFSVLPCFGDAALYDIRWNYGEVYHEKGLVLRQIARRRKPLPPGAAINLLAAQRSSDPDAAEDSMLAVTEAWERGLLRPGAADVRLIDWSSKPPTNLAALAAALEIIARDGLLAVVWPVVDALIDAALNAPRLIAGAAELAELAAEFLPEVIAAAEQGRAEKSALYLPGLRALAERGGSSRAVSAARKAVCALPHVETPPVTEKPSAPAPDTPFEELWPTGGREAALIDDGAAVAVNVMYQGSSKKLLLFTLTWPGISDRIFHVVKSWYYDLEHEGQCQAYAAVPGAVEFDNDREKQVWLHWDEEKNTMAISENRNWVDGKDGPLRGISCPPLPLSLLTVIIGLLAQDGDAVYFAPRLLKQFIEDRQIDARVVRRAAQTLLQSPVISPAKLIRALEKEIELLPVMWPILTESVHAAGALIAAGNKAPAWVNRVLDTVLRYAPYLAEAARRGLIPAGDAEWVGLSEIAALAAKSAAGVKAQSLLWLQQPLDQRNGE
ncbi:MAG: PRTRC system protein E [Clostridiales Family XIII bacterium]|nr:PRTRC system protein E [Clostridiales Family XIII bacterium]